MRIWDLPDPPDDPSQFAEPPNKPPLILQHLPDTGPKDITTLDWNPDGSLLATGSFDSVLRIFTRTGEFYMSHPQHQVCTILYHLDIVYYVLLFYLSSCFLFAVVRRDQSSPYVFQSPVAGYCLAASMGPHVFGM